MAKRQPARRGKGRGRAATSARTRKKTTRRASALAALRERFRNGFGRHAQDVWGVLLVVGGILLGRAAFGLAGPFGSVVDSGLRLLFGVWALVVPIVLVILGATLVLSSPHHAQGRLATGFGVSFVASLALYHLMTGAVSLAASLELVKQRGGAVGSLIAFPLRRVIGFWGALVVLVAFIALGVLLLCRATLREMGMVVADAWRRMVSALARRRHHRVTRQAPVA